MLNHNTDNIENPSSVHDDAGSTTPDIMVSAYAPDVKELLNVHEFVHVEGWPEIALGMAYSNNRITLYYTKDGALRALTAKSPTAAGAAESYTPVAAVLALFREAGITVENDTFQSKKYTNYSLSDWCQKLGDSFHEEYESWESLAVATQNYFCYMDLSWD